MKLVSRELFEQFTKHKDFKSCEFVSTLQSLGITNAINNVKTTISVIDTDEHLFPISSNFSNTSDANCYVVSPLSAYIEYALVELNRINNWLLSLTVKRLIHIVGGMLRWSKIDGIVYVNNWLLSTNIYPSFWDDRNISDTTNFLSKAFPNEAIAFRSLNSYCNASLLNSFKKIGYISIPSRQVYLYDCRKDTTLSIQARHNFRMDKSILEKSEYKVVDGSHLVDSDFDRIEELYNALYLRKYTELNPQYKSAWLKAGQELGWLNYLVLKNKHGRIDGVIGFFQNNEIITAPIVGYDTSLPKQIGLYRILTHLCISEAIKQKKVLNFSSGASEFKRLRGGVPEIEYSMVYASHLSWRKRIAWIILGKLLHSIAVPIMKKMKL